MGFLANAARITRNAIAEVWLPPPQIDYEKWAVENIVFTERDGDFPGPYNPVLFPFFGEILVALSPEDQCRIVTLHKSAQLGGTVIANVFLLGSQALDPGDLMYIHPTEDNATRWSKMKLKPMLREVISLRRVFPERSRDGGDSILFKDRADGRGSILISGANSPASLSMVSVDRQVQDDLAKWQLNDAGDPEQQAESRSRARRKAKIFKISTPLVMPGCRITKNFLDGSQEYYEVPCPHCGFMHVLEWGNMLANLDEDHPERAHFTCPECGCEIHNHHRKQMMLPAALGGKARWVARNPQAARYHRSFHLWSAYGPVQSWEQIAREWIAAKGDPAKEKTFLNDSVGEAYQAKGEAPPWEEIRDRAEKSEWPIGIIPSWACKLTLGLDCQKDRVEWQLVAWGRNYRRHVVEYGIVNGHISEDVARTHLDALLQQTWKHAHGRLIAPDLAAIDGNAWTEEVWDWVRRHPASRVIMVRGVPAENAPLIAQVKKERDRNGKPRKYSKRFYNFATSVLKMALYRNVSKTDPMERGFIGFARGLGDDYFQELTAERRVPVKRKDGFISYKWMKDDNQDNEALDTMLQAEAAATKLQLKTWPDQLWDYWEQARCTPPDEAQLDLEDMTPTMGRATATRPPPTPPPAAHSGRRVRSHGI